MLWSLVLLSPRSVQTQLGPGFRCFATLISFLPEMLCLYKHHLDWTQLNKHIFWRRSGGFATKKLWTSHALQQSQGQDKNRLSEYRLICSYVVRTNQSSALSAVPLLKSLSPYTHAICCWYYLLFYPAAQPLYPLLYAYYYLIYHQYHWYGYWYCSCTYCILCNYFSTGIDTCCFFILTLFLILLLCHLIFITYFCLDTFSLPGICPYCRLLLLPLIVLIFTTLTHCLAHYLTCESLLGGAGLRGCEQCWMGVDKEELSSRCTKTFKDHFLKSGVSGLSTFKG